MGDTLKWMVYMGESHLGMDDLGVPPFMETSIYKGPPLLISVNFGRGHDMGEGIKELANETSASRLSMAGNVPHAGDLTVECFR